MTGFIDQVTRVNAAPLSVLRCWLSEHGTPKYIYTVNNAIPSDIANQINVLWNNSYAVTANDPLDTFIRGLRSPPITGNFIPLPDLPTLTCAAAAAGSSLSFGVGMVLVLQIAA